MANFAFAVPSASIAAISSSRQHGCAARDMPADHFDIELRAEDGARRFRIDPDVVFRRRRHIALAAGRAAHHHAAADPLRELGSRLSASAILVSGPSVTRVRPGSACARRTIASTACSRSGFTLRRGKVAIAEAVFAVEPMRVVMRAAERLVRAGEDGHVGLADLGGRAARFGSPARGPTLPATVVRPRTRTFGLGERHDDRDGVVGSGVGVDEEVARSRHAVALSRAKPRSRSALRSSMSSRPTLKRTVGPPGAKRVAVRVGVQSKGTARLS